MFSTSERLREIVESTSEYRERIAAALQIDKLFANYEIELTPVEALSFAEVAPAAGVQTITGLPRLIEHINAAIPFSNFGAGHPKTGRSHHYFRIGRGDWYRLVKLELFKGFFPLDYDFIALLGSIHAMAREVGAHVVVAAGNNSYSVEIRWQRVSA